MKTEGSMLSPAQHGSSIAPESPLLSLFTCCLNLYSEAEGNLLQTSLSPEIVAVMNRNTCVTCHTHHTSVTYFRPKLGNPMEVTLVTSPKLYIVSHTKGTYFP